MSDDYYDDRHPITSDVGPYVMVPTWVLDLDVSDRAVRLFALMASYANKNGDCWPSRQTLAERLGCSKSSLDRAIGELEAADALVVKQRKIPGTNRQQTNLWHLRFARFEPVVTGDYPPGSNTTTRSSPVNTPLVTGDETPYSPVTRRTRTNELEPMNLGESDNLPVNNSSDGLVCPECHGDGVVQEPDGRWVACAAGCVRSVSKPSDPISTTP